MKNIKETFHKNGNVRAREHYKDGKKDGVTWVYLSNNTLHMSITYFMGKVTEIRVYPDGDEWEYETISGDALIELLDGDEDIEY